jgi:hypothetical protein
MKTTAVGIFVLLALTFTFPFQALSNSEERFGPWRYYAPYYFPPDRCCLGYCFSPDDFRPTYESPNPPQPKNDVPPRNAAPARPPKKVVRPENVGPQTAREMPMEPMLSGRPGSPAKRAFPARPTKAQTTSSSLGETPARFSPRQASQSHTITPPPPGTHAR